MGQKARKVQVRVFATPQPACNNGMTWESATAFIRERLRRRFGDTVAMEYVELFSQRSFAFPDVMRAIEQDERLPLVQVEDQIVSRGVKLSESRITRAVDAVLREYKTNEGGDDVSLRTEHH